MNVLILFSIASAICLALISLDKWVLTTDTKIDEKGKVIKPSHIAFAYAWGPFFCLVFVIFLLVTYFNFTLILTLATLISLIVLLVKQVVFSPSYKAAVKAYKETVAEPDQAVIESLDNTPAAIEFVASLFPVLFIVFVLRSFIIEPFQIPTGSMEPTLNVGDFILVNKFAYGVKLPVINKTLIPVAKPKRGDVMVFRYPPNSSVDYIKRVIGVPGDHIQYTRDKQLFINGQQIDEQGIGYEEGSLRNNMLYNEKIGEIEHIIRKISQINHPLFKAEWIVPEGYYFVMGDNRDNSKDSRFWISDYFKSDSSREEIAQILADDKMYMVPEDNVVGKAFFVWMHWPSPKLQNFPSFLNDRRIY